MPSREYRATATFLICGVFALMVLFLVQGALPGNPPIRGVVALVGGVLMTIAVLATAIGLGRQATWARAITTPMLLALVLSGAIEVVAGLTQHRLQFPLGLILGIWALNAPFRTPLTTDADTNPSGADARSGTGIRGGVALGALVLGLFGPYLAGPLTTPGGPLIVDGSALQPTLSVTCDQPNGGPPTAVRIDYRWQWSHAEPLVEGTDAITFTASTLRADDIDAAYRIDSNYDLVSPGVAPADISIGPNPAVMFTVEIAANQFAPGEIRLPLQAPNQLPAGHGSIEISAQYEHGVDAAQLGDHAHLWVVESGARCEW